MKLYKIIMLCLCCQAILFAEVLAQTNQFEWAQRTVSSSGLGNKEESLAIARDASGNIYVAGMFKNSIMFGSTVLTANDLEAVFLVKYNASGAVQWAQKVGSDVANIGLDIAVDDAGSVYVTGNYQGTATFGSITLTNHIGQKMFIAKYDTSGNVQWVQDAVSEKDNTVYGVSGHGVAVDASGNVYVTGYFVTQINFGVVTLSTDGDHDIFLVKYDAEGKVLWAKNDGGTGEELVEGVVVDGQGNVYLSGTFRSTATFGDNVISGPEGYISTFLVKYDAVGNVQWVKQNSSNGWNSAIAADGAGNSYLAAGSTIAMYNASGVMQWQNAIPKANFGFGISVDAAGNVYSTGGFFNTFTFGAALLTSNGDQDIFIVKYDGSGNVLWARNAGGAGKDRGTGIAVDNDGGVYATGTFEQTVAFGNTTLSSSGNEDVFVAKWGATGTEEWAQSAAGLVQRAKGSSVTVDDQGNTYSTGYFYGTASFGSTTLSGDENPAIYLAKWNASGNNLWVKKIEGDYTGRGVSVKVDAAGNLLLTGSFAGTAVFNNTVLTSATDINLGGSMVFIAKYDAAGNVLWAKKGAEGETSYNENNSASGAVMIPSASSVDASGNVYVTGYFSGKVNFGNNFIFESFLYDIFIAKYDVEGNVLWAKQIGGERWEWGRGIAVDQTGNLYLNADFRNTVVVGNTSLTAKGLQDSFIAKYDAAGELLWVKQLGVSQSSEDGAIAVDGLGNAYLTGTFNGNMALGSYMLSSSRSHHDMYLAKYDGDGNVQWAKRFGGAGFDTGYNIVLGGNDRVYVTGGFSQSFNFGCTSLASNGDFDIYVARYDASGNEVNAIQAGGAGEDKGNGIAVSSDGNVYITGSFKGNAAFGSSNFTAYGTEMFIARLSLEDDRNAAPAALAKDVKVYIKEGNATVSPKMLDNGSNDDCTPQELLLFTLEGRSGFTAADIGKQFAVTLRVQDSGGKAASAAANISVVEGVPPLAKTINALSLELNAEGIAQLKAEEVNGGSSDNMSSEAALSFELSKTSFTCDDLAITEEWQPVGGVGISAGQSYFYDMAIGPDGNAYVAYGDFTNGYKTTVLQWNGSSWEALGGGGVSEGSAGYNSVAVSPNGTPYIAYLDALNGYKTMVKRWQGGHWQLLGEGGVSAGRSWFQSLAIAADGTPYVAYRDEAFANKTTVKKWNGNNWEVLGGEGLSIGEARGQSLALAPDGTPYVAYRDQSNGLKVTVLKWSGSSWEALGGEGISAGAAQYLSFAIAADGTPYIAFSDMANGNKTTVLKWNGNAWDALGGLGVSAGEAEYQSLAISAELTPYIAYRDIAHGYKTTVLKWNGANWEALGVLGLSKGESWNQSLAISPDGIAYVAYEDGVQGRKTTVEKFYQSNRVRLTVEDEAGNKAVASTLVAVVDKLAPAVVVNTGLEVAPMGSVLLTSAELLSADNCSPAASVKYSLTTQPAYGYLEFVNNAGESIANFTQQHLIDKQLRYVRTVANENQDAFSFTLTDEKGNTSAALDYFIRLKESIKPEAKAKDFILALQADGTALLSIADVENGSTDNETAAEKLQFSLSQTNFNCAHLGDNSITLTVTDEAGNSATVNTTVRVVDQIAPTAVAKNVSLKLNADGVAAIRPDDIDNGSADNCSIASLTLSKTSFSCADIGTSSIILTVTDVAGNQSTASATVTVAGITAPAAAGDGQSSLVYNTTATFAVKAVEGASAYLWAVPPGFEIESGQSTTQISVKAVSGSASGKISVKAVNACSESPDTFISVTTTKAPQSITFDDRTILFSRESLTLDASSGSASLITYQLVEERSASYPGDVSLSGEGNSIVTLHKSGKVRLKALATEDANYSAAFAEMELTIQKAPATITFSELSQQFNAAPRPVVVATEPAGLIVAISYNGSDAVPSAVGAYEVRALIVDDNYSGEATAQLVISEVTALSDADFAQTIRIYPNPTTGKSTLVWKLGVAAQIIITDSAGRFISQAIASGGYDMDVSELAAGIYFVHVQPKGEATATLKLVKQ